MSRSWKRLITLILSVLVVVTYSVPVFALEPAPADNDAATVEQTQDQGDAEAPKEQKEAAPAEKAVEEAAFSESVKVDGVVVTVKAPKGVFPAGSTLSVSKVSVPKAVKASDAEAAYAFDITILDKDGNKIQPDGKAEVTFKTDEVAEYDTKVFHMDGKKPEELKVTEKGKTAAVTADGFSTYVLTFSYSGTETTFAMTEGERVALADIVATVGLPTSVGTSGAINYSRTESSDTSRLVISYTGGQNNRTYYVQAVDTDWMANSSALSLTFFYGNTGNTTRTVDVKVSNVGSEGEIVAPVAKDGLVYDGTEQALVDPGNTSIGWMQYNMTSDANSWSDDLPKAKEAGKYTVYYRVVTGSNAAVIESGKIADIEIAEAYVIPPLEAQLSYDGKDQALLTQGAYTNVKGGVVKYAVTGNAVAPTDGWYEDFSAAKGKDAGTYYVWYKVEKGSNTVIAPDFVPVVITPAEAGNVELPKVAENLKYDGSAHRLIATPGTADNGDFWYNVTNNATAPTTGWNMNDQLFAETNAGEYFVWYKLVKGDQVLIEPTAIPVTIAQGENLADIEAATGLVYKDGNYLVSGTNLTGLKVEFSVDNASYVTSVPKNTDLSVGTHTVKYRVSDATGNIETKTGKVEVEIAKAKVVATLPVGKNLTYNGQSQSLVKSGVIADGYKFMYLIKGDSEAWADAAEATDVADYTVEYKVVTDAGAAFDDTNYALVDESGKEIEKTGSLQASIADVTVAAPTVASDLVYNGSDQNLITAAGSTDSGTMIYIATDASATKPALTAGWTSDVTAVKEQDAGQYKVWYAVYEGKQFIVQPEYIDVTIDQAESPAEIEAVNGLVYNDGKALVTARNIRSNNLSAEYSLDNGRFNTNIPKNNDLSVGTHTVKYRVSDPYGNYKTKEGSVDVEIAKAKVVVTLPVGATLSYNGAAQSLVKSGVIEDQNYKFRYLIKGGDSAAWADTAEATDVADYTVEYKVVDASNKAFDDTNYVLVDESGKEVEKSGSVDASITPAEVTLNWTNANVYIVDPVTQDKVGPDVDVNGAFGSDVVTPVFDPEYPNKQNQVGSYTTKVTGLDNANYVLSSSAVLTQTFKVAMNAGKPVVYAKDMTYGDSDTTKNVMLNGNVLDETKYNVTYYFKEASANKWEVWGPGSTTPAGDYKIKAEVTDPAGEVFFETPDEGTFKINQKALTVRALDYWMAYGEKIDISTAFISDVTGLTPEDEADMYNVLKLTYTVMDGTTMMDPDAQPWDKGTYSIVPKAEGVGTALDNYAVTEVASKLYVSKAEDNQVELTVQDYTYGDEITKPAATATSGEDKLVVYWLTDKEYGALADPKDPAGWKVWNGADGKPKAAGTYYVMAYVPGDTSYAEGRAIKSFKIAKKPATIKLIDGSTPYTGSVITIDKAAQSKVTGEIEGEVGKITYEVVSDPAIIMKAGTYKLSATFDEFADINKNYSITVEDGTFTVSESSELKAKVTYVNTGGDDVKKCVFDGERHGILVTPQVGGADYDNATVYYSLTKMESLDDAKAFGETNPELIYPIHAGQYQIWYYIDSKDYAPVKGGAILDIESAYLRVKALDKQVVYGTPIKYKDWNDAQDQGFIEIKAFNDQLYSEEGVFVKEYVDGLADFQLNMKGYTDAMSDAGDYEVTTSALTSDGLSEGDPGYKKNSPDYIIRYIDATLTITPKPVRLIWSEEENKEFKYDGQAHSVNAHVYEADIVSWNGKTDQGKVDVVLEDTPVNPSSATEVKRVKDGEKDWSVGTYTAKIKELTGERAKNYKVNWESADPSAFQRNFKIVPADMYITPNDATCIFGDKPQDNGYTAKGLVNGEQAEDVLLGLPVKYAFGYVQGDNVGSYDIEISNVADAEKTNGLHAQNYNIIAEVNAGGLTVVPREITLKWSVPNTFEYDGDHHIVEVVKEKIDNDYAAKSALEVAPTYTGNDEVNAGKYMATVKLNGDAARNYKILNDSDQYDWEITKRPATIYANPNTILYRQAPADKGYYVDKKPLVKNIENGDALDNIGEVSFKFNYKKNGKPGTYSITPVVTFLNPNYYIAGTVNGTLTVNYKQTTLLATGKASGKKGVRMYWNTITGAASYDVYFSRCDGKNKKYTPKKVANVKGTNYRVGKLKKKKCYKFYVVAKDSKGKVLARSTQNHVITGNKQGKYTNAKAITVSPRTVVVSRGNTVTLSSKISKMKKKKKLLDSGHGALRRYIADNSAVATVSSTGVITGISQGWCKVYVETVNGIWQEVQVYVK